jgi:hypothetical protein
MPRIPIDRPRGADQVRTELNANLSNPLSTPLIGLEKAGRLTFQFANIDAVGARCKEGEADSQNDVGEKYVKFRVYAVEGVSHLS